MAAVQMDDWCADHTCLGPARLPDWRLAFLRESPRWLAGAADVVPHRGREVWGVLYDLSPRDMAALDRKESSAGLLGYRRIAVEVEPVPRRRVRAITYVVIQKASRELPATAEYLGLMIDGGRNRGLPEHYLAGLERLRRAIERPGPVD
jgi:hypothetical protein